jgi:signal transduction histidine kinase
MTRVEAAKAGLDSIAATTVEQRCAALEAKYQEAMRVIEELRAQDALKTQFLANISHDLRTPLTAVITHAEILRDGILGPLSDRQLESVAGIINGGRQLLEQVSEILDYARGAANQLAIDPVILRDREELLGRHFALGRQGHQRTF